VKLGVHRPGVRPGSRLERAILGLVERGHAFVASGAPMQGSALAAVERARTGDDVEVLLGGPRALGPAWAAARLRARVLVLALEAEAHERWGALERWAWDAMGGWGLVDEAESSAFLGRIRSDERERLALWPAAESAAPPSGHPDTETLERACERALARRAAGPGRAALFADRDGTLIEERHHLSHADGVRLLPGVGEALRSARASGHPVVVISNQAGVGRGLFPESSVHAVMARVRQLLRAEGVELDAIRFCPHAPDAGCDCRKPGGRLLREAADDLRLSLPASLMVGDKWIDVDAGRAVGATGVLVRTGHGAEEAGQARATSDPIFDDLPATVRWFLSRSG